MIKIDLLSVECLDKIHAELDLLVEYGKITPGATLKETYENVLGIYNIERDNSEMWKMVWNHEIPSLFQMEQQSGIQGIALIKPKTVDELAVLNSVIRLMPSEPNAKRPLELWAEYRKDINIWYQEMRKYGLTEEEIDWLSSHSAITDGICESQEGLMSLVQENKLGGNSLSFADRCRKGIAKKQSDLFNECEKEFFENIKNKNCSEKLAHYVWDVLLKVQRGYSFNRSHCLAYSLVALQEMNLAYKFPIIYWNTACLITDTGGSEDNEGDKTTNYTKLANGINKMRNAGIDVSLPNINTSLYSFKPDEVTNNIIYGFRGILGVGDKIINEILEKRPFSSFEDFMDRTSFDKTVMISLIKSGCFDSLEDRNSIMKKYILSVCDIKHNLNLQNLRTLMNYKLLPTKVEAFKYYEFNRYLKTKCANGKLDDRAINFLAKINHEEIIQSDLTYDEKAWKKIYDYYMNYYREYISENKNKLLAELNKIKFNEEWNKYATGNYSAWEMESVCFYYHEHELINVDKDKYGLTDFYSLPEQPIVDRVYNFNGKEVPIFKLNKICGTCIAKNKVKSTVKLLTTDGVVEVKFNKEYFSLYDRTIKATNSDGKNYIAEESWFNKGNKIMVTGIRSDDQFIVKKYKNTPGHRLYKINNIDNNGNLVLQGERISA